MKKRYLMKIRILMKEIIKIKIIKKEENIDI